MNNKDFVPASIRISIHLDFDSCMKHVDYNIEKLSGLLTSGREVSDFEVLNYITPIITNICKIMECPTRDHWHNTFCIPTRFDDCHKDDLGCLKNEREAIRGNAIYGRIKKSRDNAVAHINNMYRGYMKTQKLLVDEAEYLMKQGDRLNDLVSKIKSLIHNTEISVKKKQGVPLNRDSFTLKVEANKGTEKS